MNTPRNNTPRSVSSPKASPLPIPADERLAELLCDRALVGLSAAEQMELQTLFVKHNLREDDVELESTAASLELSMLTDADALALPPDVAERLQGAGKLWCEAMALRSSQASSQTTSEARVQSPVLATIRPEAPRASLGSRMGWLAAAAAIALAAIAWWPGGAGPGSGGGVVSNASIEREFATMIQSAPADLVKASWGDWDTPEISGVKGEVFWSDSEQRGFMKFVGLPKNDPNLERYQLWIIDSRGMDQRISGGIFDGPGCVGSYQTADGSVLVPITPGIRVVGAAAFAVTIEKPAGTWVSDMKRRVVIAAKG